MNAQQIAMLVLVLGLLAVGTYTLLDSKGSGQDAVSESVKRGLRAPDRDPASWNLEALPAIPEPTRSFTTENGVHVQVIEEGEGDPAALGRQIDLRYFGFLLDGSLFDEGVLKAVVVGDLRRYIEGLQEGLLDIRPYERRRILIPSEMGYGSKGSGQRVPPDADLVFDVRWIWFKKTDLRIGTGAVAKVGSEITVHYRGTLEDGSEFESTRGKEPVTFTLNRGLIPGWVLGIPGMRAGGERRLWIPAHLAYGQGRGPTRKLPPWSNLIFVIELVEVR